MTEESVAPQLRARVAAGRSGEPLKSRLLLNPLDTEAGGGRGTGAGNTGTRRRSRVADARGMGPHEAQPLQRHRHPRRPAAQLRHVQAKVQPILALRAQGNARCIACHSRGGRRHISSRCHPVARRGPRSNHAATSIAYRGWSCRAIRSRAGCCSIRWIRKRAAASGTAAGSTGTRRTMRSGRRWRHGYAVREDQGLRWRLWKCRDRERTQGVFLAGSDAARSVSDAAHGRRPTSCCGISRSRGPL